MSIISEDDARALLKESRSPAYNAEQWDCGPIEGGLVFGWRRDAGKPTMGTYPWIVTNEGKVAVHRLNETYEETINRANRTT